MYAMNENYTGQVNALDDLTGIYNRNGFYHAAREVLDRFPDQAFCLIYWNILNFKVVNDLFGRDAGDKILIHFADMLETAFPMENAVHGRLERDNFICCVPKESLDQIPWRELENISYTAEGSEYHFFACSGLYGVRIRDLSVSNMVDKARVAMESAKNNYMTPYAWYEPNMWDAIVEEQTLNSEFRQGIEEKQFKVYFQPVCRGRDGRVVGAEALVRWEHPERGLIAPNQFIPLFEKNGFISVLDRYVWNETCQFQQERLAAGLETVPISVNVSRIEFYNPQLCEDIRDIVQSHAIPTDLIKIEITESAYADNPRQVREAIDRLHEYGFVILMDDFGSGYSSLNVLKDIPIDILKIDMAFMDNFVQSRKAAIILEAMIRMAKMMKLQVVTEGVETKQEWEFLRSVECDLLQGFFFYKPIPQMEFIALLNQVETAPHEVRREDMLPPDDVIFDVFNQGDSRECMLFYSMLGGMGVLEMRGEDLEIIQVNQGYYEAIYGPQESFPMHMRALHQILEQPARDTLKKICQESKAQDCVRQTQLKQMRNDGVSVWLEVKVRYLGSRGKRSLFYFSVNNIDELKQPEQECQLLDYSAALLKVFDKVYHLDFETGLAEVLHTCGNDTMKVHEKYGFLHFFENYASYIKWINNHDLAQVMQDQALLDQEIDKSHNGTVSLEYRLHDNPWGVHEVSALFFKVEVQDGKEEYLCCIKKR